MALSDQHQLRQTRKPNDRTDKTLVSDLQSGQESGLRKQGYAAFQDPSSMTGEQVHDAIGFLQGGNYNNAPKGYSWLQALQARKMVIDAEDRMKEYQGAMLEMYGQMAEASKQAADAAAYVAPYQQPMQQADAAREQSGAEAARRQLMRKGLLSLTRYGSSSGGRSSLGVS